MADGRELKPKSFRIDDETAEKFKEISGIIGGNQQETLAKLIEAFEFQSGKAVLTDKKTDIEQFEKYVSALTRMFMGSLEDNQNITETVRMEFDALLKSKDTTIQNLQEELKKSKDQRELAIADEKQQADECSRLKSELMGYAEKVKDLQTALADKDSLNKALTDSCNDLKAKIGSMEGGAAQAIKLQEEVERLQAENASLKQAMLAQTEQAQIEMEKALLKQEKDFQRRLSEETDRYSQRLFELLGKIPVGKLAEESQPEKEAAGKKVEGN
ncbi:hypothetical protein [Helicobacter sp.]|uniref:hypothetical protein n=1 Tax=Helicobacter sp. TaxID=218 RepID=UPI0019CA9EC1|nr:hypothetical protein [Helicobacter sp.]MBD5165211.1 hypothetical protein [Helicobacter sp.]